MKGTMLAAKIIDGKLDTACCGTDCILMGSIDGRWSNSTIRQWMRMKGEQYNENFPWKKCSHVIVVDSIRDFNVKLNILI